MLKVIAGFFFAWATLSGILFIRYGWWSIPLALGICLVGVVVVQMFIKTGDDEDE